MSKKSAITSVIAAGVLWGIISIFVNKMTSYGFTGVQISFLRVFTCAVILFFFLLIYDRKLLKFNIKDVWMFIGTGIISLTLFSFCYFTTIINVEASVAVSLLYTSPVFVMLMSALLFKEKITIRKIAASILTVSGCALVSGLIGSNFKMGFTALMVGIGSGFFYALYSVFGRYATKKYNPFTITFYTFVFASSGFLFVIDPSDIFKVFSETPVSVITAIVSAVLCGILPYIFYTAGLKHLDTTIAGVLVAVEPLVGSIVGIICFHESSDLLKILGIGLILSSIILLSIEPKKNTAL